MVHNFGRRRTVVKRESERILAEHGGELASHSLIRALEKRTRYSLVPSALGNLLRPNPRIERITIGNVVYYKLRNSRNPDEPLHRRE